MFNEGDVAVKVTSLWDNAGTVSDTTDDFKPRYLSGDTDGNGALGLDEVWLYTSVGATKVLGGTIPSATTTVKAGHYVNTATVTVASKDDVTLTATDTDKANYFGTLSGIQVVKSVNAVETTGPDCPEDANNPNSPVILAAGSTVVFSYAVKNTGARSAEDGDFGGR